MPAPRAPPPLVLVNQPAVDHSSDARGLLEGLRTVGGCTVPALVAPHRCLPRFPWHSPPRFPPKPARLLGWSCAGRRRTAPPHSDIQRRTDGGMVGKRQPALQRKRGEKAGALSLRHRRTTKAGT